MHYFAPIIENVWKSVCPSKLTSTQKMIFKVEVSFLIVFSETDLKHEAITDLKAIHWENLLWQRNSYGDHALKTWSEICGAKEGAEEILLEYQEQSKEWPGTGSITHTFGLKTPRSTLKSQTNLYIFYLYLGFI